MWHKIKKLKIEVEDHKDKHKLIATCVGLKYRDALWCNDKERLNIVKTQLKENFECWLDLNDINQATYKRYILEELNEK